MAAYTQLLHLYAARLEPGERELTDEDLHLIFDLTELTTEVREEVAEELRAAGVEVLSVEPVLLLRKAAPPVVDAPVVAPRSLRRWLIPAGVVAALVTVPLLVAAAPRPAVVPSPRVVAPAAAAPASKAARTSRSGTHRTGKPHSRPKKRPHRIEAVEVARKRKPRAELRCEDGRLRSKCDEGTRGRERRRR